MKIYKTCRVCKAVYFNKTWHHGDKVKIDDLKTSRFAWTTRCPACKMIEKHEYHGLITITGIPHLTSRELYHLIKGVAKREYEKNCQRRVLGIMRQDPHTWVVTTTDRKMAEIISRRISQAFDHVELKIGPEDKSIIRLLVEFLPIFYHRFNLQGGSI